MASGRSGLPAALLAVVMVTGLIAPAGVLSAQETTAPPAAATPEPSPLAGLPQPSYEVLRIEQDGEVFPYFVVHEWLPLLLMTPDQGAWAIFGARARRAAGSDTARLYAARFDPQVRVWLPAQPLPGGPIQFLPAGVVDRGGVVHLVYSDHAADAPENSSTLVYIRSDGQGGWTAPVAIAPDANAGYQMMPSLALDAEDRLHLVWRDQRAVSPEARAALPSNADLFASDLVDGVWTPPVQIAARPADDLNPGWPHLLVDGDRLVTIWSLYKGTTAEEMKTPIRIEWSARPLADAAGWTKVETLIDHGEGDFGGQLLDIQPAPSGGLVMVYDNILQRANELIVRRLDAGAAVWSEPVTVASGDFGYVPSMAVRADGALIVVFNYGRGVRNVEVGALVVPANGDPASPPVNLTPAEEGLQARAVIALAGDGAAWIVYFHQPTGSANATEVRILRGARVE